MTFAKAIKILDLLDHDKYHFYVLEDDDFCSNDEIEDD